MLSTAPGIAGAQVARKTAIFIGGKRLAPDTGKPLEIVTPDTAPPHATADRKTRKMMFHHSRPGKKLLAC